VRSELPTVGAIHRRCRCYSIRLILLRIDEPASVFWARRETAIVSAEDAIPVSGDQIVGSIQDQVWQYAEQPRSLPGPPECRHDEKRSASFGELTRRDTSVVRDHIERVEIVPGCSRIEPMPPWPRRSEGTRDERRRPIARENGLHEGVTESAYAVVEQEMSSALPW
jgi:hypothetical protein